MLRKPVVSGQFYPGEKEALADTIERLKPEKDLPKASYRGVIMPHAGYIYSGKVAVTTASMALPKKRLIILGPNHTGFGKTFGMWSKGSWQIPTAELAIDEKLAQSILQSGSAIVEDTQAHKFEHSIEVELPILNYFFGDFKFVPIACQVSSLKEYKAAADQIFEAVKPIKEDVLFVASTDMTHYEPDATARRKDRLALDKIINLDEEGLVDTIKKENISMCGFAPVAVMISCLKKLGARKAQVALYQTSGDASGDYTSVVGYAGIVIR